MSYLPREQGPATPATPGASGAHAQVSMQRRRGMGRFLGLTALGTLLPGAGLTVAGRRRLGGTLLAIFVLGLLAVAYVVARNGLVRTALNVAVRPNVLMGVIAAVVVGALIWCGSIALTARHTRPSPRTGGQSALVNLFTAAMCLVILLPSAQVVRYVAIQRDVLGTLFNGKHQAPSSDGVAHARPDTAKADPWANTPRVNVLLLGSDSGSDRVGTRTDSMMVASIDTRTGNTVLFGIPRNLQNVPFPDHDPLHRLYPDGYNCGSQCLMNAVWTLAQDHRDLFPGDTNPGLTATRDAISSVLGLQIDYTTIIDLAGFTSLVNAMGGVEVNVTQRIPIGGKVENGQIVPGSITGWIEPGLQHMDGYHALWFARSRATTDDFSRMRRQRCMVGNLLSQVNPVVMLDKYPALAEVAKQNIQVDIPQSELPAWVELVQRIQHGTVHSLPFTNQNTNVVNPDFAKIHSEVQAAISGSGSKAASSPKPTTATSTPSRAATTTPAPSPSPTTDGLVNVKDAC